MIQLSKKSSPQSRKIVGIDVVYVNARRLHVGVRKILTFDLLIGFARRAGAFAERLALIGGFDSLCHVTPILAGCSGPLSRILPNVPREKFATCLRRGCGDFCVRTRKNACRILGVFGRNILFAKGRNSSSELLILRIDPGKAAVFVNTHNV